MQPDDGRRRVARAHQQRHMVGRIDGCPERYNLSIGICSNGQLGARRNAQGPTVVER